MLHRFNKRVGMSLSIDIEFFTPAGGQDEDPFIANGTSDIVDQGYGGGVCQVQIFENQKYWLIRRNAQQFLGYGSEGGFFPDLRCQGFNLGFRIRCPISKALSSSSCESTERLDCVGKEDSKASKKGK